MIKLKKVAIQKGLTDVEDYLRSEGYDVQGFDNYNEKNSSYYEKFDAVVVSGQDKDFLGMEKTSTKVSAIDADGMTPQQVKEQIEAGPSKS